MCFGKIHRKKNDFSNLKKNEQFFIISATDLFLKWKRKTKNANVTRKLLSLNEKYRRLRNSNCLECSYQMPTCHFDFN